MAEIGGRFNAACTGKMAPIEKDGWAMVAACPPERPILIAGPTASGKSALALEIAERWGGVIVNADASQVYDCWRIVTARPPAEEEHRAPHLLYGHIGWQQDYSAGHWLREVAGTLTAGTRPIIVGGTGLYFRALTQGLAEIPATPPEVRAEGDALPLGTLLDGISPQTAAGIDRANRARVQRAWEVERATGRALHLWQADTPAPILPLSECLPLVFDVDKDWLGARIARRFDLMLAEGAMAEVAAMAALYDPARPAFRAIGVPELMACHEGEMSLEEARDRATISTRQFAKRQRTWFRAQCRDWHWVRPVL